MDGINDLNAWLNAALVLWNAGLTLTLWLRKPGADAGAAVRALEADQRVKHGELNNRVITLEERVRHMPTSDELSELEGTVRAINERTEGLAEAIGTVRTTLNGIETFLLHDNK